MPKFTVIGYWDDDDYRRVVGVVEGEVEVGGGESISEGGPFAEVVEAPDADAAEGMVDDTGADRTF